MMELAKGLFVQIQVVHALILRETRTRFGANQLGYLWAFIEPLMWIGTFAVMFYLVKRRIPDGMDVLSFLASGIVIFLIFRQTTTKALTAIGANKALLFYPQIRPLDLVIARSALEISTLTLVFAVILAFNALMNRGFQVDSLLMVIFGLVLVGLLGASLGVLLCALSVFSNSVERMATPFIRPLLWISGVFFTANELPSHVREMAMWNPVLHIIEIVRGGLFVSYEATYADWKYPVYWILGFALCGLTAERVARRRLEVT